MTETAYMAPSSGQTQTLSSFGDGPPQQLLIDLCLSYKRNTRDAYFTTGKRPVQSLSQMFGFGCGLLGNPPPQRARSCPQPHVFRPLLRPTSTRMRRNIVRLSVCSFTLRR